jgi:hypothetical protein
VLAAHSFLLCPNLCQTCLLCGLLSKLKGKFVNISLKFPVPIDTLGPLFATLFFVSHFHLEVVALPHSGEAADIFYIGMYEVQSETLKSFGTLTKDV